jgi:hypothetical protein
MRKLFITLSLVGLAGAAAAHAENLGRPCTDKPESAYLSLDALKTKLVEQGYEIRSGEFKNACGEFHVLDKLGQQTELFLDPTSGVVVSGGPVPGQAVGKIENEERENETNEQENGK